MDPVAVLSDPEQFHWKIRVAAAKVVSADIRRAQEKSSGKTTEEGVGG